ncbi:helix-turn-helix transcriptional regulator [Aurantiacibacter odishensis]|uniref:helix-turn-helix transcriptional regulator n=1 Tax=Aurantiacibacter odishensis TaxID=1155476 RepID=UPI000E76AEE9|nr:helix-turn-helix transcriptional regulator [Aurantiacibacter odishensis]
MRIPNLGETELLVPLHDGMFEKPMWDTFLKRLKLAARCDDASLLIHAPDSASTIHLTAAPGSPPGGLRNLLAAGSMREGRVYSLAEMLESAGERQRDPARTMLGSAGIAHIRAVRLSDPGGLNVWLALSSREAIPPSASALLSALVPHMRVALRVLARMEEERARASMTAGAFSHIDFGWIAVDRRCHVVDMDEQAERFLSRTGSLRQGPYGRLTPSAPAIDRELTALVKEFADKPDARPRAVNLSQDPWIDILVSPVRVASLSAGGKAVAVVYFRGDQSSSADRCQQLVDVFKLTQSEARFAWSLAQGISIADAAQKHGLTIESARQYSKKIYAKTGAKGQVDFMRRVLTSVVALTVH